MSTKTNGRHVFFYGDRCCMKKHGIAQDTPSFPLDDKDEVVSGPIRGGGNAYGANLSSEHA